MKLFGVGFGREKPMAFLEFRDHVRLITRRAVPGVRFEHREFGFVLNQEGKPATACNLRGLYAEYLKSPAARDRIIERWIDSLTVEIPDHCWAESQPTLRPVVKNAGYLAQAQTLMRKNDPPDLLPFAPFAGDLSVIVMRELPGTVVAVTQRTLETWGVSFHEAMRQALANMNMRSFPPVSHALVAGAAGRKDAAQEQVGLVFEGDHLTASWLIVPRFREYLTQLLQGDYVAHVPTRGRLTAVRADESGLISQIETRNRNCAGEALWLTTQGFHVSGSQLGGVVTVYKPAPETQHRGRILEDPFFADAKGGSAVVRTAVVRRAGPVDLRAWGGLAETTEDRGHKEALYP